jgi:DNA-binding transcriptional regulator YiaG
MIQAARKAAGITQTQAAELIHCSLRSWQQWEAGDRDMHPAMWELFTIKLK